MDCPKCPTSFQDISERFPAVGRRRQRHHPAPPPTLEEASVKRGNETRRTALHAGGSGSELVPHGTRGYFGVQENPSDLPLVIGRHGVRSF